MVSGNGFGQNESVTITFDSKVIGTGTAVQTKFSQKVNVPGSATPGNHTVTATDDRLDGFGNLFSPDLVGHVWLRCPKHAL